MRQFEFSKAWAAELARLNQLDNDKQEEMAYAIQLVLITLVDAMLTLAFGAFLGVLCGTAFCLLTVAAFRHNAGGGHSGSPYRCALVTMIVFPLFALAAHHLFLAGFKYINVLSSISIVIGFLSILKYAPASNAKSPPLSDARRKRLKIYALLVMALLTATILVLPKSNWILAEEMGLCITLSIIWVSFNLTEVGYHLWRIIDGVKYS